MFNNSERRYVSAARVGRLATADGNGRPQAVPVCFAMVEDQIVSPIDEKPKATDPTTLRRVRDIAENPAVTLLIDHYTEDWTALGWVQIRGTASLIRPGEPPQKDAISALRAKYEQYGEHLLEDRPLIQLAPGHVRSWGNLRTETGQ